MVAALPTPPQCVAREKAIFSYNLKENQFSEITQVLQCSQEDESTLVAHVQGRRKHPHHLQRNRNATRSLQFAFEARTPKDAFSPACFSTT